MAKSEKQPLLTFAQEVAKNPFHEVDLEMIALDVILDQDLYIQTNGQYVLYRRSSLPFTAQDKLRLLTSRKNTVFINAQDEHQLRRFYEANLSTIIDNEKIPPEKKAHVLYQCATGIAKDIFDQPQNREAIGRSREIVTNTIGLLAQGSDAFVKMISLSGHDYYTYTHCVNVMTFTIGLLSAMGVKDQQVLKEAGIGALLHDVGKAKVPLEVLNKPGPLTQDEWKIMKQHPNFGFEMLAESPVPDRGKEIVVQHHEKINGIGYPYGLRGDKIPIVSQVVSICDAYDAMTTNRVYQKAKTPMAAFKIITEEMRGHFDPKLVEAFIRMLNLKKGR